MCAVLALAAAVPSSLSAYPLTELQQARLKRYIPITFAKLSKREHVHILAIGDSITTFYDYNKKNFTPLKSYYGIFARQLAREFFYTGWVRDIKPGEGKPVKLEEHLGPEITIQNMGKGGRMSMYAMMRLSSDALDYKPDLVLMNFGVNDSMRGLDLRSYLEAFDRAIEVVKAKGMEVIVIGPSFTMLGPPKMNVGLARPYVSTAREVAEKHGVLFTEFGQVLAEGGGVPPGLTPTEAWKRSQETFRACFKHAKNLDLIHPTVDVQERMGDHLFDALMGNDPGEAPMRIEGTVRLTEDGAEAELTLKNQSDKKRRGYLIPLWVGRVYVPVDDGATFELEPFTSKKIVVAYRRDENAGEVVWPLLGDEIPGHEPLLRLPFLAADSDEILLLEARAPIVPVGVSWKLGMVDGVRDVFRVEGTVHNPDPGKPVSGSYECTWSGQSKTGTFSLPPSGTEKLELTFKLPDDASEKFRVKAPLDCRFTAGGHELHLVRGIEASRNLALGQSVELVKRSEYDPIPRMATPEANKKERVIFNTNANQSGLLLVFDILDAKLQESPPYAPVHVIVRLDARQPELRRKSGHIGEFVIGAPLIDGPIETVKAEVAGFGEGYWKKFPDDLFTGSIKTLSPRHRRVTVMIPRKELYNHEWKMGTPGQSVGIDVGIDLLQVKEGLPPVHPRYRMFRLVDSGIYRLYATSLSVLNLTRKRDPRWSLRFF